MAATLTTPPPVETYAADRIHAEVTTDQISGSASYFEISVASSPAADEVLELAWPGGGVIFTAADPAGGSADEWPLQPGGQSLADYADDLADFLRDGALLPLFNIMRDSSSGEKILLTYVVDGAVALSVEENTLAGITVAATSGAGAITPDNLRAVVRVHSLTDADTGADVSGAELITVQGSFVGAAALLDLSAGFHHLRPFLPDPDSIIVPDAAPSADWYGEVALSAFQQYRLRVGERHGNTSVVGRLDSQEDTYTALRGSRSLDSVNAGLVSRLCHDYTRRDGENFRKLVSRDQPDWLYVFTSDHVGDSATATCSLLVHWSDGTTSNYSPFGDGVPIAKRRIYVFAAGFRQLRLSILAPSGATDPDAYIVGYDLRIGPQDDSQNYMATAFYDVAPYCHDWNTYLLFETGLGGLETAWLRGKSAETFDVTEGEEYERLRWGFELPADYRDYDRLGARGRAQWQVSTGWHADPAQLIHLRQLALRGPAWLVDVEAGKFRPVHVEPTGDPYGRDDDTLHEITLRIRSDRYDLATNL